MNDFLWGGNIFGVNCTVLYICPYIVIIILNRQFFSTDRQFSTDNTKYFTLTVGSVLFNNVIAGGV